MASKLVVIINSFKVPKIKKILLYEIKFLVPNYGCLQNPWLGGYRPQIPILSVLNWICWTPPKKIPGYVTAPHYIRSEEKGMGSVAGKQDKVSSNEWLGLSLRWLGTVGYTVSIAI